MHAFAERLPQTSQSCSAAAKRGGRSTDDAADAEAGAPAAEAEGGDADYETFLAGGSADSADAEAGADSDAAGEGGGGEEVGTAWTVADVDGTVAALDGFSPFFFVMGWRLGVSIKQQKG